MKQTKTNHDKPFKAGFKLNYTGGIKMKTELVILASVLLIAGIVGIAYAAAEDSVQASVTVPGSLSISITDTALVFGSVVEGGPYTPSPDPLAITVDANKDWAVTGEAPVQFSAAGSGSLASSNLNWKVGAGVFAAYGTTISPSTIVTGGYGSGQTTNVNHQLTIPTPTTADTYTLDITYKIA